MHSWPPESLCQGGLFHSPTGAISHGDNKTWFWDVSDCIQAVVESAHVLVVAGFHRGGQCGFSLTLHVDECARLCDALHVGGDTLVQTLVVFFHPVDDQDAVLPQSDPCSGTGVGHALSPHASQSSPQGLFL